MESKSGKRDKKSAPDEAEDQLTSWISSRETRLTGPLDMAEVPKCWTQQT
jgi:hypothetical protein